MSTYTVIGSPRNRGFRVLWMLEELGLRYTLRPDAPRSDAVRALNPLGKVPVLLVGDEAITDSVAIMTYLADKHGGLTHPAGTLERARQDALTQFLLDEFDALLWMAAKHSFTLPEEHRVPAVRESLRWEFSRSLARFETFLGDRPYLTGDSPTVPDLLAGHCIGWAVVAKFPPPDGPVKAYSQRLRERPAYQRAREAS